MNEDRRQPAIRGSSVLAGTRLKHSRLGKASREENRRKQKWKAT